MMVGSRELQVDIVPVTGDRKALERVRKATAAPSCIVVHSRSALRCRSYASTDA